MNFLHERIDAPSLIEGPIDGESFRTYVEKVLLPTLRPGDIVVLDNLGSHRGKAVRQLIRSAVAKLFLPKYSPDLNPIEQIFAKLKHRIRRDAARTIDAVCAAIGEALPAFTPKENARAVSKLRLSNLMSSCFRRPPAFDGAIMTLSQVAHICTQICRARSTATRSRILLRAPRSGSSSAEGNADVYPR